MLDHIGVARWLGIPSTADLWAARSELAHFTSALRYPVFVGKKNYNGAPPMVRTTPLVRLLNECLREEATALPDALWVPLGLKAEAGVQYLVRKGHLEQARVLSGLLHPSGANNERVAYFIGRKARDALSVKTVSAVIDRAREELVAQVARLR